MIFTLVIGFALLAIGGAFIFAREKSAPDYLGSESKCLKYKKLREANDAIIKADNIMCTYYCPCDLKISVDNLFDNQTETNGIATKIFNCDPCSSLSSYDENVQGEIISWINSNLGVEVSESNCKLPDDIFEDRYLGDYDKYIPLLKWIEKEFDCSGLCSQANLFLFSDINRGIPTESCRNEVYNWIRNKFLLYGLIIIGFGVFQVILM